MAAGQFPTPPAYRGRTRKSHHSDARVRNHRLAHVGTTWNYREQSRRQTSFLKQTGDHDATRPRSLGVRLQDHGIADSQRWSDGPHAQNERKIPWCNHANNTKRHTNSKIQTVRHCSRQDVTYRLRYESSRLMERGGRQANFEISLPLY